MGDDDFRYKPKPFRGKEDPLIKALKDAHPELAPDAANKVETGASDNEIVAPPKKPEKPTVSLVSTIETPAKRTRSILRAVCDAYSTPDKPMTPAELAGKGGKDMRTPRHVAAYMLKNLAQKSLNQIGRTLGDKDHATILHSCRWVEERMKEDETFKRQIAGLEAKIREKT